MKHGRVDRNHAEIRDGLRDVGASVQSLADVGCGCPDLLVGFRGKNFPMEVKMPGEPFTEAEMQWHFQWRGTVYRVETLTEALKIIGA